MTGAAHERWQDATGAYVLGLLEGRERSGFEEHLAGCPACREEVAHLRVAAEALPAAVDPIDPPPELKERIMAEVRRDLLRLKEP